MEKTSDWLISHIYDSRNGVQSLSTQPKSFEMHEVYAFSLQAVIIVWDKENFWLVCWWTFPVGLGSANAVSSLNSWESYEHDECVCLFNLQYNNNICLVHDDITFLNQRYDTNG